MEACNTLCKGKKGLACSAHCVCTDDAECDATFFDKVLERAQQLPRVENPGRDRPALVADSLHPQRHVSSTPTGSLRPRCIRLHLALELLLSSDGPQREAAAPFSAFHAERVETLFSPKAAPRPGSTCAAVRGDTGMSYAVYSHAGQSPLALSPKSRLSHLRNDLSATQSPTGRNGATPTSRQVPRLTEYSHRRIADSPCL